MPTQHRLSALIGFGSAILGAIVAIIALPFWMGAWTSDIAAHGKRLDVQRVQIDSLEQHINVIDKSVACLQTDMAWFKMMMEKMYGLQVKHYKVSESNNKFLQSEKKREDKQDKQDQQWDARGKQN